jgi:hypothetical protein
VINILKHDDYNEKTENGTVTDFEQEKMSLHRGRRELLTGGFESQGASKGTNVILENLFKSGSSF